MIAQELAICHPNRIRGLVLVCTHCGGTEQVGPSAEVSALFKEMIFENTPESKIKAASTLFDRQTLEHSPEIPAYHSDVSLKNPAKAEILIKQWQAVLKHDTCNRLHKITAPTFVLPGASDLLIPQENSKICSYFFWQAPAPGQLSGQLAHKQDWKERRSNHVLLFALPRVAARAATWSEGPHV